MIWSLLTTDVGKVVETVGGITGVGLDGSDEVNVVLGTGGANTLILC